jgi:DNA polymerase I-like protein with 3'-5' exonuclease and polymerase domains
VYTLLETQGQVEEAAGVLKQSRVIAVDLETTGLDPHSDRILLVVLKGAVGPTYILNPNTGLDFTPLLAQLHNSICLAHNALFEHMFLESNWLLGPAPRRWFCTQLAEGILTNGLAAKRASLAEVVFQYAGVQLDKTQQTSFVGAYHANFVPTEDQLAYAAGDVEHLHEVMSQQTEKLRAEGLLRTARLEMALLPAVSDMQLHGFKLDTDRHAEVLAGYVGQEATLRVEVTARLDSLYQRHFRKAEADKAQQRADIDNLLHDTLAAHGIKRLSKDTPDEVRAEVTALRKLLAKHKAREAQPINLQSSDQVLDALSEDGIKLEKTEKGETKRSLDKNVVADYLKQHPDEGSVLHQYARWAKLNKVITTYGDTLRQQVHAETGRVHSSFNQNGTASGRFSSDAPNLQNVPTAIRACFCAEEGNTLVVADAKNQEGRIAAALSGDKNLLRVFREGGDWHCMTAAIAYPEKFANWEAVPKDSAERAGCKNANFSSIYGGSAYTLYSRGYVSSLEVGERLMVAVAAFAPRLVEWTGEVAAAALAEGYATTVSGRKRYFPVPTTKQERGAVERAAMNLPIQGSAADIMKQTMIYSLSRLAPLGFRMVAMVHDELVCEGPVENAEKAKAALEQAFLEGAACFIEALPVPAEVTITERWVK